MDWPCAALSMMPWPLGVNGEGALFCMLLTDHPFLSLFLPHS